jgi:hypothetical protein
VLEADVKPVSGTSPGGVTFGSSGASGKWTHAVCSFSFENNGFSCGKEDNSTAIATDLTYSNGNWYRIRMVLDRSNNMYYLFLNGTLINTEGFSAASATPEWFSLGAGNVGTNTMYYDNVNTYSTNNTGCITA